MKPTFRRLAVKKCHEKQKERENFLRKIHFQNCINVAQWGFSEPMPTNSVKKYYLSNYPCLISQLEGPGQLAIYKAYVGVPEGWFSLATES